MASLASEGDSPPYQDPETSQEINFAKRYLFFHYNSDTSGDPILSFPERTDRFHRYHFVWDSLNTQCSLLPLFLASENFTKEIRPEDKLEFVRTSCI